MYAMLFGNIVLNIAISATLFSKIFDVIFFCIGCSPYINLTFITFIIIRRDFI